jgi:hypothetical protein
VGRVPVGVDGSPSEMRVVHDRQVLVVGDLEVSSKRRAIRMDKFKAAETSRYESDTAEVANHVFKATKMDRGDTAVVHSELSFAAPTSGSEIILVVQVPTSDERVKSNTAMIRRLLGAHGKATLARTDSVPGGGS